jgi:hypothetical protein
MTTTLKDFLPQRKAQIKAQMAALKKELQAIQTAEGAIVSDDEEIATVTTQRRKTSKITIKDMIVAVLENKPEGADSFAIIDLIKEKYGKDVPRPSISPQLSRLKTDDGLLGIRGSNWVLLPKKKTASEEAVGDEG